MGHSDIRSYENKSDFFSFFILKKGSSRLKKLTHKTQQPTKTLKLLYLVLAPYLNRTRKKEPKVNNYDFQKNQTYFSTFVKFAKKKIHKSYIQKK